MFVCENNQYATATPLTMATLNTEVASKAAAYGIPGVAVDGNDVLAVYAASRDRPSSGPAPGGGPTLIEAKTYRVVGHHEGDPLTGTYRTQEELDSWKARCPIATFREKLIADGRATAAELDEIDRAGRSHDDGGRRLCPSTRRRPIRPRPTITCGPSRCIRRSSRRRPTARPGCKPGSKRFATASPRKCAATNTSSTWARAPASGAAASRTPRDCGTNLVPSG